MNRTPTPGARRVTTPGREVVVAAAAGGVTGLASTYPWELGPVLSLTAWALVGVLVGMLVGMLAGRAGSVLTAGAGYGVLLTVAFLYSRFGGAAHDLPAYTVFVVVMSVGAALCGAAIVFAGSRLRRPLGRSRLVSSR